MSPLFDEMYADEGRPSIPPERLLKAQVLIALYSVRSRHLFAEQLQYNLLFRWFLDLDLTEASFDHSSFSKNKERLLKHAVAEIFFQAVVSETRLQNYISDEHFTVDGTLIEAWASLKSFKAKTGAPENQSSGDDPGNPTVNFHGEKRSNQTHQSSTDPEARLYKKGKGKEAKLCFGLSNSDFFIAANQTLREASPTMFFLVTGASGVGKTSVRKLIETGFTIS